MMKKIILIGNIIISILILFVTISVFLVKMPVKRQLQNDCADGGDGWYYDDGTSAVLSDLQYKDNTTQVSKTLKADSLEAFTLCFDTANVDFIVYLNGEAIYDYHPELAVLYGTSYGLDVHTVTIPYFTGEADLTIQAEDLSKGTMWAGFRNVAFDNGANYIRDTLTSNFLKCFLAFLIFTVGFAITIFGLILKNHNELRLEMISLGTLAMILSMWTITGSYFLGMLTGNSGYIRAINYLTLIMLPLVGITLVASLTKRINSRSLYVVLVLTFLNLFLHMFMLIGKRMDYHDLLLLTHIVFVIGVILAVIMIVQSYRQNRIKEKQQRVILVAFFILMASGIADLIFYYFVHSINDACVFSRFGLLIFVILLTSYEVNEFIRISQKNREMEVVRRMAYEDGLTGLENRLSFGEYEEELKKKNIGICMFVQFDINYLKTVNDTYGHSAGDDFIISAANIIRSSFGKYGRVFRIGGDEFIVVILIEDDSIDLCKLYEICEEQMAIQLAHYNQQSNSPIPLQIAYGMAVCDLKTEELSTKEILADERMYERKRTMKKS